MVNIFVMRVNAIENPSRMQTKPKIKCNQSSLTRAIHVATKGIVVIFTILTCYYYWPACLFQRYTSVRPSVVFCSVDHHPLALYILHTHYITHTRRRKPKCVGDNGVAGVGKQSKIFVSWQILTISMWIMLVRSPSLCAIIFLLIIS